MTQVGWIEVEGSGGEDTGQCECDGEQEEQDWNGQDSERDRVESVRKRAYGREGERYQYRYDVKPPWLLTRSIQLHLARDT